MPALLLALFLIIPTWFFPSGETVLLKHLEGKVSFMTTDELSNLYLVRNDVLEKYDGSGKFLYSYSLKMLGPIDFVDPSDPMKIVLFYKSFPEFAVLENTLTPSGDPVSLQDYNLQQATLICRSYERGYWLYNQANFELVHLREDDLNSNKSTGNISQLLNLEIHPNFLLEQNNRVFLNDPENGILVFDIFGAYYKTISIKHLNQFQVSGDKIIYYSGKKLNTYNLKTLTEETFNVPDSTALGARIEKERLFLQTSKGVDIYAVH